jgi:succinate dehydrogenase flavin-adding protein (antitoxin of CptAB toxin-antitoxin module)
VYRSKQRGFLELDLVLGTWVEQHIHSMDEANIRALLQVLDLVRYLWLFACLPSYFVMYNYSSE